MCYKCDEVGLTVLLGVCPCHDILEAHCGVVDKGKLTLSRYIAESMGHTCWLPLVFICIYISSTARVSV